MVADYEDALAIFLDAAAALPTLYVGTLIGLSGNQLLDRPYRWLFLNVRLHLHRPLRSQGSKLGKLRTVWPASLCICCRLRRLPRILLAAVWIWYSVIMRLQTLSLVHVFWVRKC